MRNWSIWTRHRNFIPIVIEQIILPGGWTTDGKFPLLANGCGGLGLVVSGVWCCTTPIACGEFCSSRNSKGDLTDFLHFGFRLIYLSCIDIHQGSNTDHDHWKTTDQDDQAFETVELMAFQQDLDWNGIGMEKKLRERMIFYRFQERPHVHNDMDSLDAQVKDLQQNSIGKEWVTLTTHVFLFQIECEMTDLQMFQFIFMKIWPTPDPCIDNVRKAFPTSDLAETIHAHQTRAIARELTCNRPSNVLWIVTHFVGICPFDVIDAINASSSSFLSLSFFTKLKSKTISMTESFRSMSMHYLSIARLAKVSLSPLVRCRWQSKLATIPLQASEEDPFTLEDEAPFNGGLCEWGEGDVGIMRDDAAAANDGWIRRSMTVELT